jgi:acylphosphatase
MQRRLVLWWVLAAWALGANQEAGAMEESPRPAGPVARLVHYAGFVQGVGFRATTASMARDRPVTGYVKNLPDGRVEVLVEGSPEAVKEFLQAVRTRWKRYVQKEEIEERPALGKYTRFEISH